MGIQRALRLAALAWLVLHMQPMLWAKRPSIAYRHCACFAAFQAGQACKGYAMPLLAWVCLRRRRTQTWLIFAPRRDPAAQALTSRPAAGKGVEVAAGFSDRVRVVNGRLSEDADSG